MQDNAADLVGQTLANRYRVERLLANGSMGPVLAAQQLDVRREVCLKILRREKLADDATLQRFAREARLIARLQHPNIVRFYSHGTTPRGDLYLAMELVPGQTLEGWLQRGPFDWRTALGIMVDLLSALQVAHRAGVIHRDIKHGNIVYVDDPGPRSYAKLLDFGIAGLTRDSELVHEMTTARAGRLTESGIIVGTPGYIAPEVLTDSAFDARADLYALGVVWWEMLVGRRMFGGERLPMLIKHMTEPAPTLASVGVEVPAGFEPLIMSLLEKDADRRPASAVEVLEAISAIDFEQGSDTELVIEPLPENAETEPIMKADIDAARRARTAVDVLITLDTTELPSGNIDYTDPDSEPG